MAEDLVLPLRLRVLRWEKRWGDLVATDELLSTDFWEIDWSDVDAIWVGRLASGQAALTIRPRERSDLRMKGSRLARLIRASRHPQLAGRLFDRPLNDVVAALSAKTGRPFGTPPAVDPLF